MAGHSKWANIKHRKERVDNKRGKAFSRAVKEIYIAAKLGGEDAAANPRLRLALQKAREVNLPKDNIDKAIKRGTGKLEGSSYEEVRYEGYGPDGFAVIVDCLTDNRNRTTSEVRHAFSKHGGTLGTDGSVAYMFERVGQFLYAPGCDQDQVVELGVDAGAADYVIEDDGSVELLASPQDFEKIHAYLAERQQPDAAEITMRPQSSVSLAGASGDKARRLLEALEDCDDTQQVYSNAQLLG